MENERNSSASIKHGGGSVMTWECKAANGTVSLVFTDDGLLIKRIKMDSEVYQIQPTVAKLIGSHFIL